MILFLPKEAYLRIGALGRFRFPRGYYIYIGSAMNGLESRIRRHLGNDKRLFWHIDYFVQHARVVDVWSQESRSRWECVWARKVLELDNARVIVERFGASDCRCRAHLVHLTTKKRIDE